MLKDESVCLSVFGVNPSKHKYLCKNCRNVMNILRMGPFQWADIRDNPGSSFSKSLLKIRPCLFFPPDPAKDMLIRDLEHHWKYRQKDFPFEQEYPGKSFGESPICPSEAAVLEAKRFILELPLMYMFSPDIHLVDDGEVNFFWRKLGFHIDLGFYGDETYSYFIEYEKDMYSGSGEYLGKDKIEYMADDVPTFKGLTGELIQTFKDMWYAMNVGPAFNPTVF